MPHAVMKHPQLVMVDVPLDVDTPLVLSLKAEAERCKHLAAERIETRESAAVRLDAYARGLAQAAALLGHDEDLTSALRSAAKEIDPHYPRRQHERSPLRKSRVHAATTGPAAAPHSAAVGAFFIGGSRIGA